MKKHTAKNRARQLRRQRRRERKKHRRVERLAGYRASVRPPSSPLATFEEFLDLAARLARPGDSLHVVECSGGCGRPVHAWLERAGETEVPPGTPERLP